MQSKSTAVTPALPPDPYVAGLWQQWRTQLRLTMKTPWLATKWLEESRKLLDRAGRIYTHLCRQPRPIRRRLQRQLGASLAGVALALALANAPVQAADFTANDAASLIAAINSANNETTNPGPDTITLTGDVTLTASDAYVYSSDTGLPVVNSEIKIEGAGYTIARDAGAPEFRLMAVGNSGDLTLNAVTLSGGNSRLNGGAIFNHYGTLALNNSTLSGNTTASSGGAIYSKHGTLALNDSTLSDNTSGGLGAGFANRYGTVTVSDSTFSDNAATDYGGGFFTKGGTVTVSNSTLSGNSANRGGAIHNNQDNTLTVSDSTFSGNSARFGGAFYNNEGTLTVNNSTLSGNTSIGSGGVFYDYRGTVTVNESILSNNTATSSGGGFRTYSGAVTVNNSTLSGNTGNKGGGFYNYSGTVAVNNSTLSGNASGSGGGFFNYYDGTVALNNSTLSGNTSDKGGGFYNYSSTVTVRNSTLSDNAATNSGGGIHNYGTVTLNRTLISGNSAGNGAEIYNYESTIHANNFNLIGHSGNARSYNFTPGVNDIVPSGALATILDITLADNGGPSTSSGTATLTHALVPGSPAIDAAGDSGFDTDQRGIARPQGAADDIGAFEVESAAAPEIDITGNGVSIVSGDNEPDSADHTNFGSADIDGGTVVRTFTISNTGDAELSGIAVSVDSGLRAAAQTIETLPFSVTSAPATTVAPGESTEFQITFDPSEVGGSTAVVIIESNDADEGLYNFAIGGIGSERLVPNTHLAAAATATQSCETGSAGYVYDCTVTFNLSNSSSSVLAIGHYRVNIISNHAYVLNGEPTPGQAGTTVQAGTFVNAGDTFQPEFVIGLTSATRYTIRFSVFGVADPGVTSASADATSDALVELGTFDVTFDPTAEPGVEGQSFQLYLPTVVNQ